MFGFGSNKRRGRSDTFAPSRIRGAALAGLGMLAWQWWRKRQAHASTPTNPETRFSEPTPPSAGIY